MNVEIRRAVRKDLPAILALYAQPEMDDGEILTVEEAEALFDKIKNYPHYHLYVALYKKEVVGTFALLVMDNLAHKGAPSGIVEDVMVSPHFQGRGVGKEMMVYAKAICKKMGCYKLVISSNQKRSKAHAFYESLGFKKYGFCYLIEL